MVTLLADKALEGVITVGRLMRVIEIFDATHSLATLSSKVLASPPQTWLCLEQSYEV
jgi:hypothetical protein